MTALPALRRRKGDVMETLDLRQIFFFPPGALRRVRTGLMLRMSHTVHFYREIYQIIFITITNIIIFDYLCYVSSKLDQVLLLVLLLSNINYD
jgi:hypothetical protein